MRQIITNVYTIDEHPNKKACYEWIRDNWHDLNQHSVHYVIDSLKALSSVIGGTLDYCISSVPDRGEHITFTGYCKDTLKKLKYGDQPLTGVCWDYEAIKGLQEGNSELVLEALHKDTEYAYSDVGLYEMCEANEYEFEEGGDLH